MVVDVDVKVTKSDICQGKHGSEDRCAIAKAMSRALGKKVKVVAMDGVCAWSDGRDLLYLPPEVQRFIRNFDGNKPVFPFTFTLTFTLSRDISWTPISVRTR